MMKTLLRLAETAAVTLVLLAVCQELEKPKEQRKWHGKVAGFVPYDFRLPTANRLKQACWNPDESRILAPQVFGLGWLVNLYALLNGLGVINDDTSEESFLLPTPSIKKVLVHPPTAL